MDPHIVDDNRMATGTILAIVFGVSTVILVITMSIIILKYVRRKKNEETTDETQLMQSKIQHDDSSIIRQ